MDNDINLDELELDDEGKVPKEKRIAVMKALIKEEWKNPWNGIFAFCYGVVVAFFFFVGVQAFLYANMYCDIYQNEKLVEQDLPYFVAMYEWNKWIENEYMNMGFEKNYNNEWVTPTGEIA